MTTLASDLLDRLTAGADMVAYRAEARAFLSDLMQQTPREAWSTVLPVGQRLLVYPDWRETITPQAVLEFCLPWHTMLVVYAALRAEDYRSRIRAEYLLELVEYYRESIGRPSVLPHRPDEESPDYSAVTRAVSG